MKTAILVFLAVLVLVATPLVTMDVEAASKAEQEAGEHVRNANSAAGGSVEENGGQGSEISQAILEFLFGEEGIAYGMGKTRHDSMMATIQNIR